MAAFAAMILLTQASAVTLSAGDDATMTTIPANGSAEIPFTVTVDCLQDVLVGTLEGMGSYAVTVTGTASVGTITSPGTTVSFSPDDCADPTAGGTATKAGVLSVSDAGSVGMEKIEVALDANGATDIANVIVDYAPGYDFTFEGGPTFEVSEDSISFPAEIAITANAMSMAMFQVTEAPKFGIIEGLPEFMNVASPLVSGDGIVPLEITYTPTSSNWESDSITFTTWSHFINDGSMKTQDQVITWTFNNANAGPGGAGSSSENKESPGAGILIVGLGILAAVAVARRS